MVYRRNVVRICARGVGIETRVLCYSLIAVDVAAVDADVGGQFLLGFSQLAAEARGGRSLRKALDVDLSVLTGDLGEHFAFRRPGALLSSYAYGRQGVAGSTCSEQHFDVLILDELALPEG